MLIGLSGKAQTGKTTVANFLAEILGGQVISFADALRQEVSDHYGFDLHLLRSARFKELSVTVGMRELTVREILQHWGAMRREQDAGYWLKKTIAALPPIAIIDDVRYRNEADAVKELGYLFRIEPHALWQPGPGADHISETDLDGWSRFDAVYHPHFGVEYLRHVAEGIARGV